MRKFVGPVILGIFLLCVLLSGCGGDSAMETLPVPRYTQMKNVNEAPAAVRRAADAVVMLRMPTSGGTGFFVSPTGLLVTNNHVLGAAEESGHCARQGCFVHIAVGYQIGNAPTAPTLVFAEPKGVDVAGDISLFQLWTLDTPRRQFPSPHHLAIRAVTATALVGTRVHVLGHPHASVKKWTTGDVFRRFGRWLQATSFVLPGSSGSPIVDDAGSVVGIVHRVSNGHAAVQRNDVLIYTTATAGADVARLVAARPNVTPFFDVTGTVTDLEQLEDYHDAYYMNRRSTYRVADGARGVVERPVLEGLEERCQARVTAPARTPNDFEKIVEACRAGLTWINCRNPGPASVPGSCPQNAPGANRLTQWRDNFAAAARRAEELNRGDLYFWLTRQARLETVDAAGERAGRAALDAYLAREAPPLDLLLASYLIDFGDTRRETYQGRNVLDYFRGYRQVPRYEYDFPAIRTILWIAFEDGALTPREATAMLDGMFSDPTLPVGEKLYLESEAYRHNYFRR